MNRQYIIRKLKPKHKRIKSLHVRTLALFGSVARNEARKDSDVDFVVDFEGPPSFDQYMRLKFLLEDTFKNKKIDLVTRSSVRAELRPYVERDAVNVA